MIPPRQPEWSRCAPIRPRDGPSRGRAGSATSASPWWRDPTSRSEPRSARSSPTRADRARRSARTAKSAPGAATGVTTPPPPAAPMRWSSTATRASTLTSKTTSAARRTPPPHGCPPATSTPTRRGSRSCAWPTPGPLVPAPVPGRATRQSGTQGPGLGYPAPPSRVIRSA
jgi:hypothetical protein